MPYPCGRCNKEIEKQQGYEYRDKLFWEKHGHPASSQGLV